MKKLVLALLAFVLLASPCFANQTQTEMINETLSGSTTNTGWHEKYVGASDKVTFFVTMDSSSTTIAVTAEVTIQVSVDGVNWTDVRWYDLAGGTTAQVSETLDRDMTYVMWLDRNVAMPHVRVKVIAVGATKKWPADSAAITVTIVENQ